MKSRTRSLIIPGLIILLVVGLAGAWAWHASENFSKISGESRKVFFPIMSKYMKVKYRLFPRLARPSQEVADDQEKCRFLKAKLVAEFPSLEIIPHPVPDAENGFLQLHLLGGSSGSRLPVSKEFDQILNQNAPWDSEMAKRCLSDHADLVNRIEHIAALPTRSSSHMPPDYIGFMSARVGKNASDILLLKARLAAEAKDETEALRLVSAACNIGSHYHDVEAPSLLCETVVALIDLSINETVFKNLLPALGPSADLGKWKSALGRRDSTDFAKVVRGEWNIGADYITHPLLLAAERDYELPDAEAVIHSHASMTHQYIAELSSRSLADLVNGLPSAGKVPHLSKEGRQIMDIMSIGSQSWTKGYVRGDAIRHQHRAALELLVLEKSGGALTVGDVERVTRDPVSGAPFIFDPVSRQLSAPPTTAALPVEPLALPW